VRDRADALEITGLLSIPGIVMMIPAGELMVMRPWFKLLPDP
jgi:hypothetical protein